jgi:hypothetical protein
MAEKKLKTGQWVAVSYIVQVQPGGLIPIGGGVFVPRDVLGDDVRVVAFDNDPRPHDQPVNDQALRELVVKAEFDAATARSDTTVVERRLARIERDARAESSRHFAALAVEKARVRLLTAMVHEEGQGGIFSLHTLLERVVQNPCQAYVEHVVSACGGDCCHEVERVDPCVLDGGHHGKHRKLNGDTFDDDENDNHQMGKQR